MCLHEASIALRKSSNFLLRGPVGVGTGYNLKLGLVDEVLKRPSNSERLLKLEPVGDHVDVDAVVRGHETDSKDHLEEFVLAVKAECDQVQLLARQQNALMSYGVFCRDDQA